MSIGLLLKSEFKPGFRRLIEGKKTPEQVLGEVEKWLVVYCADLRPTTYIGQNNKEKPTLFCKLHPAAEDVEITFIDSVHVTANANTSTVGPGFHIYLCDMLHKIGEKFNLNWEKPTDDYCDETGYFHSGDRQQVYREMKAWLKGLASMFFDGTLKDDGNVVRVSMPLDVGFDWNARAITPLGPRTLEWLKKTANDPDKGTDFFSWWNSELDAEYFLRRALVRMWSDVRWRPPINDRERHILAYVAASLETAYKLDPGLPYPWSEWAEILGYLQTNGDECAVIRDKANKSKSIIGYRRHHNVAVQLPGNWWITLPGSFSDFEPAKNHNYFALDPPREVWVTSYTFKGDLDNILQAERQGIQGKNGELVHEDKNYVAYAEIKKSSHDGHEFFALQSSNIGLGHRAVCSVIFTKPEERDWAIRVWKSLRSP